MHARRLLTLWRPYFHSVGLRLALGTLVLIVMSASLAPWFHTIDPMSIAPARRLLEPNASAWMGTDMLGRDVWSRVIYGGRVSLQVGVSATFIATSIALVLGIAAGWWPRIDQVCMSVMDGLMSIPGILLAIMLSTLFSHYLIALILAVTLPEIPRATRLVRAQVLATRHELYIEAAIILGGSTFNILCRHILPRSFTVLIVQSTYIFAAAILNEAILSFLGIGTPPEVASWGNMIAEGRLYFSLHPGLILFPGGLLSLTVLSLNTLGDSLRKKLGSLDCI